MRVVLFLSGMLFTAARLCSQTVEARDKDRYVILETVLFAEESVQLFHEPNNNLLLDVSHGLKEFQTIDTTIVFDNEQSKGFREQLQQSSIKLWDPKKIYRFTVIKSDPLAGVGRGENEPLDSAHMKLANKTVRVHRVALPVFLDQQSAFMLTASRQVTFLDGKSVLNTGTTRVYFLRRDKKRWKITSRINLSSN
jgi:hypothetical protein